MPNSANSRNERLVTFDRTCDRGPGLLGAVKAKTIAARSQPLAVSSRSMPPSWAMAASRVAGSGPRRPSCRIAAPGRRGRRTPGRSTGNQIAVLQFDASPGNDGPLAANGGAREAGGRASPVRHPHPRSPAPDRGLERGDRRSSRGWAWTRSGCPRSDGGGRIDPSILVVGANVAEGVGRLDVWVGEPSASGMLRR